MPTYTYKCSECNEIRGYHKSITDVMPPEKCDACGSTTSHMHRHIGEAPNFSKLSMDTLRQKLNPRDKMINREVIYTDKEGKKHHKKLEHGQNYVTAAQKGKV